MLFCMWAVETAVLGRACPARRACCSFCSTCAHMSCEVHTATCTYSACADSTQRGPRRGVCSQPRGSPWHRMARLVPFTKLTCLPAAGAAAWRSRDAGRSNERHTWPAIARGACACTEPRQVQCRNRCFCTVISGTYINTDITMAMWCTDITGW